MINVNDKKSCTGCHACLNICSQQCIKMGTDNEGFWYPVVDVNKCKKCGLCEKACPILQKEKVENAPQAYACINKNEAVRLDSSSGGVFTLIAEQILNNGGVVFGASFGKDFNVVHSYVKTIEDLRRLRGSKYVQSRIGDTYKQAKEFLEQGGQVLFAGTPCQIGGLKSFLGKAYDNLFCVDIVCHGVPSPKVWQKYVSYRESRAGVPARRIAFRRKNYGWKRYAVSFLFKNDTAYLQTLDKDLYMQAFLKNICLRPSCYACSFKTLHRQSDITLADFWGIQNICPEMDDNKGTSLIFVNSTAGKSMLNQIKDKILYKDVDINQAVSYNPSAVKSVEYNQKRESFFEELDQLSFDQLVKKYCRDSMLVRAKRKIKFIAYIALKKAGLLNTARQIKRGLGF